MRRFCTILLLLALTLSPAFAEMEKVEIKVEGNVNATARARINAFASEMRAMELKVKWKSEPMFEAEREEKKPKAERFHFYQVSALMLLITGASLAVTRMKRRLRRKVNMLNNILLAFFASISGATGLMSIFNVKHAFGLEVKFWHVISSEIVVYIILLHFALHWRSYLTYIRELAGSA